MRIVSPYQEFEDRHSRLGLRPEPLMVEQLTFPNLEESLAQCVVVTVPGRPYRRQNTSLLALLSEGDRGVLAPLVGMMDDRRETAAGFRGYGGADINMTETSSSKGFSIHDSGATPAWVDGVLYHLFTSGHCTV